MALVKKNKVISDAWTFISEFDAVQDKAQIIVSLELWQNHKQDLLAKTDQIGIVLKSDERAEDIEGDLDYFGLIALEYPTFMDGRAYSQARLLRERYDYKGEVRAVGNVLQDQLFYMERCGFDAFEIDAEDEAALQKWLSAQSEMSVFYQPTGDGRKTALSLRERRLQEIQKTG